MKTDGNIPFRVLKSFNYQKATIDIVLKEIKDESNTLEVPITVDYNFVYNTTTKELIGYREVQS